MKNFIKIFSIFFVISCSANEVNSTHIFEKANQFYKDGKFERAIELYKKIPNKSAYVNYNLGNCSYKLSDYGNALLYWRRAERNWGFFNRSELLENIMLLKQTVLELNGITVKKPNSVTLFFIKLKNLVSSWIRTMPLFILQFLFLLLWLFLFTYLRFLYKKRKKYAIVTLFSLIAFFGIILVVRYSFESKIYGVVIEKQVPILSGPGETFQKIMQLYQAQEVVIKKESGDYYKIKALNTEGTTFRAGWVDKKFVKTI